MTGPSSSELPKYQYFNVAFVTDYVVHVEVNRPQKLNAWIEAMWLELRTIMEHLSVHSSVRAIVLSGAGPRAFTSGLDVAAAAAGPTLSSSGGGSSEMDPARKAFANQAHILEFQACISSIEACAKPVAVALHGFCFGLAIDLATCCDVRFASNDARLSVKEVDIGIAADIGTLTRLPKVVGNAGWVKDVCLTARIFGAEEAAKVGFVNEVCEGKEGAVRRALEWAKAVAGKSPVAVNGTKEILNFSREHDTQDGLKYTAVWNSAMLQTTDVPEAIEAGMQKRKPTFEKL